MLQWPFYPLGFYFDLFTFTPLSPVCLSSFFNSKKKSDKRNFQKTKLDRFGVKFGFVILNFFLLTTKRKNSLFWISFFSFLVSNGQTDKTQANSVIIFINLTTHGQDIENMLQIHKRATNSDNDDVVATVDSWSYLNRVHESSVYSIISFNQENISDFCFRLCFRHLP